MRALNSTHIYIYSEPSRLPKTRLGDWVGWVWKGNNLKDWWGREERTGQTCRIQPGRQRPKNKKVQYRHICYFLTMANLKKSYLKKKVSHMICLFVCFYFFMFCSFIRSFRGDTQTSNLAEVICTYSLYNPLVTCLAQPSATNLYSVPLIPLSISVILLYPWQFSLGNTFARTSLHSHHKP